MKILFVILLALAGNRAFAGPCADAFMACINSENTCDTLPTKTNIEKQNAHLCEMGLVVFCVERVNARYGAPACADEAKKLYDNDEGDDDDDATFAIFTYKI